MYQNIIPINVMFGGRGHQIGRLVASCSNVLWYDHFKNGKFPWLPASSNESSNISKYHFDRRFHKSLGVGVDEFTVPPVLDIAIRNGYDPEPIDSMINWSNKISPNNIVYPLHSPLDISKSFFNNSKHIVVLTSDIDALVKRYIATTAHFVYSYPDPVNKNSFLKKTFYQKWSEENHNESFEEWVKTMLTTSLNNYENNITADDFVLDDPAELLHESVFLKLCSKFDLIFNEENFYKVKQFVENDNFAPDIIHRRLTLNDRPLVEEFCKSCQLRGFSNNDSLQSMKFDWCLKENGIWVGTFKNNQLIALSGAHKFKDGFRGMFRGAQLESRPTVGLDRYQRTAYCLYDHLPLQMEYVEQNYGRNVPIYVTTNISHDASGTATRVHNLFKELGRVGMFECCGDEEIFYTMQTVWKLNKEKYFDIRR
jgi:hypothetical protein